MDCKTIIITGATGFVGSKVLARLLQHSSNLNIVLPLRRPLADIPPVSHGGTIFEQAILTPDLFEDWNRDPRMAKAVKEAYACIWCIGSPASEASSVVDWVHMTHDLTMKAATVLATAHSEDDRIKPAPRFVFVSGALTSRSEMASKATWPFNWEAITRAYIPQAFAMYMLIINR